MASYCDILDGLPNFGGVRFFLLQSVLPQESVFYLLPMDIIPDRLLLQKVPPSDSKYFIPGT